MPGPLKTTRIRFQGGGQMLVLLYVIQPRKEGILGDMLGNLGQKREGKLCISAKQIHIAHGQNEPRLCGLHRDGIDHPWRQNNATWPSHFMLPSFKCCKIVFVTMSSNSRQRSLPFGKYMAGGTSESNSLWMNSSVQCRKNLGM